MLSSPSHPSELPRLSRSQSKWLNQALSSRTPPVRFSSPHRHEVVDSKLGVVEVMGGEGVVEGEEVEGGEDVVDMATSVVDAEVAVVTVATMIEGVDTINLSMD